MRITNLFQSIHSKDKGIKIQTVLLYGFITVSYLETELGLETRALIPTPGFFPLINKWP